MTTPLDDAALLPCPFCGGDPVWESIQGGQAVNFDDVYRVNCSKCFRMDMPWWSVRADCIRDWNTRVSAPSASGGVTDAIGQEVIRAACALIASDIYVHPMMTREEAVKSGYDKLEIAVAKYEAAQPAQAALTPTTQEKI